MKVTLENSINLIFIFLVFAAGAAVGASVLYYSEGETYSLSFDKSEERADWPDIWEMERVLNNISQREYIKDIYDCEHFSNDFARDLAALGFQTFMVTALSENSSGIGHRYVAVAIEPQNGQIIRLDEYKPIYIHYISDFSNSSIEFKRVDLD